MRIKVNMELFSWIKNKKEIIILEKHLPKRGQIHRKKYQQSFYKNNNKPHLFLTISILLNLL